MDIVKPYPKDGGGWRFPSHPSEYPDSTPDSLFGSKFLHEVYFRCDEGYEGKYSVPVLWDKITGRIVNNESEDIMRMLNTGFNAYLPEGSGEREMDFYPEDLQEKVNRVNSWMMPNLNFGVYKAGFALDQESYDEACRVVFETLDRLEGMLASHDQLFVLATKAPTEIDLKLYTTLIRFDAIYQQHFKLMIRSIRHGYPCLHRWLKHMYWKIEGVKETTNFKHIKENYSKSHASINPKAITPLGPEPDMEAWTKEDEAWRRGARERGERLGSVI